MLGVQATQLVNPGSEIAGDFCQYSQGQWHSQSEWDLGEVRGPFPVETAYCNGRDLL